jgi:2-hydroxycyclohexanecarboxyl-CoA dehydrogenase
MQFARAASAGYGAARMAKLEGKVAFVTGAASGIGRAIARRLAADGARVAVADLNLEGARTTEEQIRHTGGQAVAVQVDVTQFDAVQAAVRQTRDALGPVGILVNNAGWDRVEPFTSNTPELWDKLIAINLKGPIHCCRAVLDDMIAAAHGTAAGGTAAGGKIVSISSDAARVGSTGEAVYAACKGGIISFSKTLARELARYKINVNVVCPGPTDTPLLQEVTGGAQGAKIIDAMTRAVPFRRLGTPDEVAAAVAFFASADADFITGQVLSVSGGLTMAG